MTAALPMATLSFVVPGPPVPKARARTFVGPGGHMMTLTPRRTKQYERHVGAMALLAMMQYAREHKGQGWPAGARWFRLSCHVFAARNAGDLSNFLKALEDGMNRIVWPDDRAVRRYGDTRLDVDRRCPRAEVKVEAFL